MLLSLAPAQVGSLPFTNLPSIDTTTGAVVWIHLVVRAATNLIYGRLAGTDGHYVSGVIAGDSEVAPDPAAIDSTWYEHRGVSVAILNAPPCR